MKQCACQNDVLPFNMHPSNEPSGLTVGATDALSSLRAHLLQQPTDVKAVANDAMLMCAACNDAAISFAACCYACTEAVHLQVWIAGDTVNP
jgi:hypothetical protein